MNGGDFDTVIVGGGITGTALMFVLARYSDVKSIALVEKHGELAALNSSGRANSQTLHCGDIETNYTLEKAARVKAIAHMIVRYGEGFPAARRHMRAFPKMVLAVGEAEVEALRRRHAEFAGTFPYMELWEAPRIAEVEPDVALVDGRPRPEPIVASGALGEICAIDYGGLAHSFAAQAAADGGTRTELALGTRVTGISVDGDGYRVETSGGGYDARSVAVCAGAHSLLFAHRMGHGEHLSLLPVAGSFYFTPRHMRGKVYTMQDPKLPFAALHADPDLLVPGKTRLGPTALVLPKLERYQWGTYLDFLRVLGLDLPVASALWKLFGDTTIRNYILRNMLFEVPWLGKRLFLEDIRKVVPSLALGELSYARGMGGVRPQVIDRERREMLLGEAVVDAGGGLLFSITPSPGASTCLGNAIQNAASLVAHLGARLDHGRIDEELGGVEALAAAGREDQGAVAAETWAGSRES
ncbi:MAG: FAD-dependent oxidoreductase [Gammaproteobacteria bacterium]|nr:FAD-dependent oxidoreductase [Gammaproteobacteria bacterium]